MASNVTHPRFQTTELNNLAFTDAAAQVKAFGFGVTAENTNNCVSCGKDFEQSPLVVLSCRHVAHETCIENLQTEKPVGCEGGCDTNADPIITFKTKQELRGWQEQQQKYSDLVEQLKLENHESHESHESHERHLKNFINKQTKNHLPANTMVTTISKTINHKPVIVVNIIIDGMDMPTHTHTYPKSLFSTISESKDYAQQLVTAMNANLALSTLQTKNENLFNRNSKLHISEYDYYSNTIDLKHKTLTPPNKTETTDVIDTFEWHDCVETHLDENGKLSSTFNVNKFIEKINKSEEYRDIDGSLLLDNAPVVVAYDTDDDAVADSDNLTSS